VSAPWQALNRLGLRSVWSDPGGRAIPFGWILVAAQRAGLEHSSAFAFQRAIVFGWAPLFEGNHYSRGCCCGHGARKAWPVLALVLQQLRFFGTGPSQPRRALAVFRFSGLALGMALGLSSGRAEAPCIWMHALWERSHLQQLWLAGKS